MPALRCPPHWYYLEADELVCINCGRREYPEIVPPRYRRRRLKEGHHGPGRRTGG